MTYGDMMDAIAAKLEADIPSLAGKVKTLSGRDLEDHEGHNVLTLTAPAVRLIPRGTEASDVNLTRTLSSGTSTILVFLAERSLAGGDAAAREVYPLLESAKRALAGFRIAKAGESDAVVGLGSDQLEALNRAEVIWLLEVRIRNLVVGSG